MTYTESILCGFLQGITEFLPISSSGHLALAHAFFGSRDAAFSDLTFDILLHLATLLAVFAAYFRDILSLAAAFFTLAGKIIRGKGKRSDLNEKERLAVLVLLGTLPLFFAFFISDRVEALASYPKAVGGILILNGLFLLLGEKTAKGKKRAEMLPLSAGVGIGFCQLLAVLPGLSRSGSTVTGGRLFGLSPEEAVRFSFILSVPAVLGANILGVGDLVKNPIPAGELPVYLAGMATAAVCGFASVCLLKRIAKKSAFAFFAFYCMAVGLSAVVFG